MNKLKKILFGERKSFICILELFICILGLLVLSVVLTDTRYKVDLNSYPSWNTPQEVDDFTFSKYWCIKNTSVCYKIKSNINFYSGISCAIKTGKTDEILKELPWVRAPAKWKSCNLTSECTTTEDPCGHPVAVNKRFYFISSLWYPNEPINCAFFLDETHFQKTLDCIQNECVNKKAEENFKK